MSVFAECLQQASACGGRARGVLACVSKVTILALCFGALVTASEAGARKISTAEDVEWLIGRAEEIHLPIKLPRCFSRHIPNRDEEELAEEALEVALSRSTDGVIGYWQFTCGVAPDFYKAMKRFWRGRYSSRAQKRRLEVAPVAWSLLGKESSTRRRRLITAFVLDILEDSSDAGAIGRGSAMSPEIGEIFRGILSDPELVDFHEFVLNGVLKYTLPLSDETTKLVLGLATGPHSHGEDDLLMLDNQLLSGTAARRDVDEGVLSYLLGCVDSDQCDVCRAWCVSGGLIRRYGEKSVVPVYLKALEGASAKTPILVSAIVRALDGKYQQAAPSLIALLSGSNARLKVIAIRGLEKIFSIGAKELGYQNAEALWYMVDFDEDKYRTDERLRAVELISKKWLAWWEKHQEALGRSAARQR